MPSTNVKNLDVNQNTPQEIRGILGKIYTNISFSGDDTLDRPFVVKRNKGGGYEIKYNSEKIGKYEPNTICLKIISSIETLESLARVKLDMENAGEFEKYLKNKSAGAIQFFYSFLFEFISIHKSHISPSYAKQLETLLNAQALKLGKRYNPIPKHIDFLLGIVGIESVDSEVREAIENLKQANILSIIFDSRQSDGEKLKNINANILPLYKYFLGYDKYKYKPQKKVKDKVAETKGKVDEITQQPPETPQTEEAEKPIPNEEPGQIDENPQNPSEQDEEMEDGPEGNPSPGEGGQGGSQGQGQKQPQQNQEQQGFPDYQDTYKTPEGGNFEKDPDGKGFKIEIHPGLLGYYVNDHKSYFNKNTLEWTNKSNLQRFTKTPATTGTKYTLTAFYTGDKLKAIPIPYSYTLDLSSLKYVGDKPDIYRDDTGAFYIKITKKSQVTIDFYKEDNFSTPGPSTEDSEKVYLGKISANGEQAMSDAKNLNDILEKVRHIRDYVQKNHFYPAGKNSEETMNNAKKIQVDLKKNSNAGNYIQNLDNSKHLECYSANTLFVAMLRNIGIEARMVTGFHVQNFNKNGDSELNSSNGHGWCEIWDGNKWIRFDATPPKDPNDPANKPDPNEKKEDTPKQDSSSKENKADDGGEDSEGGEGGGESSGDSEEGKEDSGDSSSNDTEGDSSSSGNTDGEKNGSGNKKGKDGEKGNDGDTPNPDGETSGGEGEQERNTQEYDQISENAETPEEATDFDPEEEFNKMYEELEEDSPTLPDEDDVDDVSEQITEEEATSEQEDEDERFMRNKYPQLSQDQVKEMGKFLKDFRRELAEISKLKNPDFVDGTSENETLEDELKSIMDRVVSRSIKESEFPRYPVDDGYNLELIDPVQLYLDAREGKSESYSFKTTETREEEELKIVKVRRRKILDASGSMGPGWGGGQKLEIQKRIEVLDNKVTAEKQRELEELSNELDRDVRLETETWQFGVSGPYGKEYAVLKPMSSDFHELEQATIWKLAERANGGTNDFDPLEEIHEILLEEHSRELKEDANKVTILERIRAGFLVRELNAHKELDGKGEEISREEQIHFDNLNASKPMDVFRVLFQFMTHKTVEQQEIELLRKVNTTNVTGEYKTWIQTFGKNLILSKDELEYFKNLDISSKSLIEIFDEWLQVLKEKDDTIEPILEIIEVSSDGGSNDPKRLQEVVRQLRGLGVIVIAYGLGNDGKAVEDVYENGFNPAEGGYLCKNLLDYPRKKAKAWHNILDKV